MILKFLLTPLSCWLSKIRQQTSATSRGQTNLDFGIAVLIFVTFVTATFFAAGSPLVVQSDANVALQTPAETALVQVENNAFTDSYGRYDSESVDNLMNGGDLSDHTNISDDLNTSLAIKTTTPNNKPRIFNNEGTSMRVGGEPPSIGTYTASTTVMLDGRPVRLNLTVWRKQ
jgi:uncharacterized protein (UPF0333 family)